MQDSRRIGLRTLGQFALQIEAAPVRMTSRKGCGLLAILAMHPEYKESRKALATLLWGNRYDKFARQNLRQCLATLRNDLAAQAPDLLVIDGETIGLCPERICVDARDFIALAQATAPPDLDRAAALYRGEFLSGVSFDVEPFDEWVTAERTRLASAAARVFETQAMHYDRLADGRRAIAAAERLTGIDPLREEPQRLLLRLYARYRGTNAALAHARVLTSLLKRELGVEPDARTAALIADIGNGAIAPVAGTAAPASIVSAPAIVVEARPDREGSHRQDEALRPSVPDAAAVPRRMPWRPLGIAATVAAAALGAAWLTTGTDLPGGAGRNGVAEARAADMAKLAANAIVPVVVLPFAAPAGDADARIADAITTDLIDYLSRYSGLRVISRQTAMHYRGQVKDAAAVGAELGVRYVIDGAVRTEGDRARINVQLIDTATRHQKWSNLFERANAGRMHVQDEIARRLARELAVEATIITQAPARAIENPEIAELIARGRAVQYRGPSKDNVAAMLGYFEEALRRDPDLVPALVGVAGALVMGSIHRLHDPVPALARARQLLDRAIEIDPDSPLSHYWSGVAHKANHDFDLAIRSLRRAIDINPSIAPAYAQLGSTLTLMGRHREAMPHIQTAMRLSPKDRTMGYWVLIAGQTELELGNDAAALEWLLRAESYIPSSPMVHRDLAALYALMGDKVSSARHVEAFHRHADSAAARQLFDLLRTDTGRHAMARMRSGVAIAFASSM